MQRGHRRPRVAAQRPVHRRPGRLPGFLADPDHDPAHLLAGPPLLRGPPGWSGGDGEVDGAADVEGGRQPAGGAREALRVTQQDEEQGEVGLEEPEPVHPGEEAVEDPHPRQAGEAALQAPAGQPAEADRPVEDDRVADPQAGPEALRVVVGKLVDHREAPHLQRVHRDIALAGAGVQDGETQRSSRAGGNRPRGGDARPPSQQRHRDRGADRRRRPGAHRLAQRRCRAGGPSHEVGEYRSRSRAGEPTRGPRAPPCVIRMAALWRPHSTSPAPTRSKP